jgi:hypothetical protein
MSMLRDYLAAKGLGIFPSLALVIFAAAFLGVLGYVIFGLKRSDLRDRLAALPLEGDGRSADQADVEGRVSPP